MASNSQNRNQNNQLQEQKCPKCNMPNRVNAVHCNKCGFKIRVECTGCHKTVINELFCDECGQELKPPEVPDPAIIETPVTETEENTREEQGESKLEFEVNKIGGEGIWTLVIQLTVNGIGKVGNIYVSGMDNILKTDDNGFIEVIYPPFTCRSKKVTIRVVGSKVDEDFFLEGPSGPPRLRGFRNNFWASREYYKG